MTREPHDHGHSHGSGKVLVGGWSIGSLTLMSDAGHMFTDSSSLAIGALTA